MDESAARVNLADERFLRSAHATPSRTLIDILEATAARHPGASALDDGHATLTYAALVSAVDDRARLLHRAGVRPGDRVGVRIPSGTDQLYVAILAVLRAGAAYVPVDVDDPEERAATVFAEADVVAVLVEDGGIEHRRPSRGTAGGALRPRPEDDAWVIFTSGSTGTPKGVAVRHRSAAALVDAESRLFVTDAPIGPGDRVLAGLSVAFDASCEEMWLAWAHGACLVPAPRALVRAGMDLGPWLVARDITVISTVPTLAGLWRPEELARVRLLIFGGEACPAELAARLAVPGREVWNTYGPTETTVVACAALMTGSGPVRIGHALDGWDLAVLDDAGAPVGPGDVGELVIGGVGVARYLDVERDRERFAAVASLGWERAYRSGDLVRYDPEGLVFVGRGDDQVKLGGRRIELGEIDAALQQLADVAGAAAAVRTTAGGSQALVGYVVARAGASIEIAAARRELLQRLPAPLVPLIAVIDALPTRSSGKVDREALPWPLERVDEAASASTAGLAGTAAWLAEHWERVLGTAVAGPTDDFFDSGGGSLAAAQLVASLRGRYPTVTVADVYENPRVVDLARRLDELAPAIPREGRPVAPVPRRAQLVQSILAAPLAAVGGFRWLTWVTAIGNVAHATGHVAWVPTVSWWWVLAGWLLLVTPLGRMGSTVVVARVLLRRLRPGQYPRGGSVHLRLWFVESFAAAAGAENLAGAPWVTHYARALGATIGDDVDLHSLPPLSGLLTLGAESAIEPEVDLSGHWLDGDVLHVGRVRVGARATVGTRSILAPGARVGEGSEVAPGSAVLGHIPPGEKWGGSPAVFVGPAPRDWPLERAPRASSWLAVYGVTAVVLAALPLVAGGTGLLVLWPAVRDSASASGAAGAALGRLPVATLTALMVLATLTVVCVRLLGIGVRPGHHAVRGRVGWQVWATLRVMDEARTMLFPLYSSLVTPAWLRLLGAQVGRDVEASTVLLLPGMTTVGDGAFLADDSLVGSYELGRGWLRIERAKVGKRAFLGNSGMTAPGRKVPKRGLVAVLSAAPEGAKAGTSWLGSPPVRLRRSVVASDPAGTFTPAPLVRVERALVEILRVVPAMVTVALALGVALLLAAVLADHGALVLLAAPGVILAAGVLAAVTASAAKWLLVGRVTPGEHPLWSPFVWRNELADTFVELVAVPWFVLASYGTPALNVWLRSLGAHVGSGVWCETYWLPEADLVSLGDAVTVNRGCVLQTHLFHDRVMSLDTVVLATASSIGPHGVVLPAASIGPGASVGPSSLVLRGDAIPAGTRWRGNPISSAGETTSES